MERLQREKDAQIEQLKQRILQVKFNKMVIWSNFHLVKLTKNTHLIEQLKILILLSFSNQALVQKNN